MDHIFRVVDLRQFRQWIFVRGMGRRRVRALYVTRLGAALSQMTVHEDHDEDQSDDHAGDGADDDAH